MPFQITRRVHFGYMREVDVYHDLSDADMDNLERGKYGHRVGAAASSTVVDVDDVSVDAAESSTQITMSDVSEPTETSNAPEPTRPDDPQHGSSDPEPQSLHCPDGTCKFRVGAKSFKNAAALEAHRNQTKH